MDVLMRQEAPLEDADWDRLDQAVIAVARRILIGRRFLPLYGPLGGAVEVLPVNHYHGWDQGRMGTTGDQPEPVAWAGRTYLHLPLLYKDFVLFWRDMEQSRQGGMPLDVGAAQAAAAFVAEAEDHLIFHGSAAHGVPGLLTVEGRHVLPMGDWTESGRAFADVVRAVAHLTSAGFYPPYQTVVGPSAYAELHRLYGNSGLLEADQIAKLTQRAVLVTPVLDERTAVVVALGEENCDLVVGYDLTVAYLETSAMNPRFRVLETIAPRIQRPGAIAVLTRTA
ncbi:MAG: bacteriocin family protein [Firmicutes bacterium]|nr:bacteriocin family protein [Alicyclobacillaceae bacterium]MCL6496556.1 bacteriocin family protein [Bacillota bacterium]